MSKNKDLQERKERQPSRPYQAPRVVEEKQLVQDALATF
jgi:hypothetical protein